MLFANFRLGNLRKQVRMATLFMSVETPVSRLCEGGIGHNARF